MKLSKEKTVNTLLDAKHFLNVALMNINFAQIEIAKNIELSDYQKFLDCEFIDIYLNTDISSINTNINKINLLLKKLK